MTTTTLNPTDTGERDSMRTAMLVVGALGLIGLAGSFENVAQAAAEHGMARPWLLPLGIDGAIAGFTWFELKLAERNRRKAWLGLFVWLLTGVTVALNVLGQTDPWSIVAHAALPLLWKASVAAAKAWMRQAVVSVERVPLVRWVCAPWPTLRLWRRMRVWGITSYDAGLDLERRRVLARIEDRHGSLAEAPARQRELYRLIAAAAGIDVDDTPALAAAQIADEADVAPVAVPRRPAPARTPRQRHRRQSNRVPDVDLDVVGRVRKAVDALGVPLAEARRDEVLAAMRATPKGGVHATKVGAALRHLKENP